MKHEIKLSLVITDFELSPDILTEIIGIQPTKKWLKGDLVDERATIKYKTNGWKLYSGVPNNATFEEHLNSLINIIKPNARRVIEVCKKYSGELSCAIYLSERSEDSLPAVHFEKSTVSFLNQLGIEIDLDLYIVL